ncbi:MAG: nucleotide-binding domain containing protein, partial [Pseudomonadota bacterium]
AHRADHPEVVGDEEDRRVGRRAQLADEVQHLGLDGGIETGLEQQGLPLAYSSADPEVVRSVQEKYGREAAAEKLEGLFAEVARLLVAGGVNRLITAGGETSGAVVEGLNLNTLEIGPEIAAGVPALRASNTLVIALKSGNFGGPEFFSEAADVLAANEQV